MEDLKSLWAVTHINKDREYTIVTSTGSWPTGHKTASLSVGQIIWKLASISFIDGDLDINSLETKPCTVPEEMLGALWKLKVLAKFKFCIWRVVNYSHPKGDTLSVHHVQVENRHVNCTTTCCEKSGLHIYKDYDLTRAIWFGLDLQMTNWQ